MSRIDDVIQEVKAARAGSGRAWIFDDNGNIAPGVICGDVIPLLEDLKAIELDVTDEWIDEFREGEDVEGDNTYNWGANISNDLNIDFGRDENGEPVMVIMVHLYGDIRGGYSDYFAVRGTFEDLYNDFDDAVYQSVDINDRYYADINIFSEGYTVYDSETGEDIGDFYEPEVEDLLKEIAEHTGEDTTD